MFGNVNVDYKPCKTTAQLKKACNYILGRNPDQVKNGVVKTRPDLYYAFDDDRDNFAEAVLLTRRLWNKPVNDKRSNLAYKMSISFHPDDNDKLSYEEAFNIARDFADRYFHSKGFDVMFAVHTDRQHIHAHFIIGNCNRETGKSFRRNQKDLYEMSEFFGKQCESRGLFHSVREDYYSKNPWQIKERFNEAQMTKKGKETFKAELREAIEKECRDTRNHSFEDVIKALREHYHVEARVKGNTVSYRHPEYKNKAGELVSVRGSKLGEAYTKGGIENVINELRTGRNNGSRTDNSRGMSRGYVGTDETACDNAKGAGARSKGQQGSGNSAHISGKSILDTAELFSEYAVKVKRTEQESVRASERAKRVQRKRSGQHR